MQGIVGYFLYGIASRKSAREAEILSHLPENLPLTHEWIRKYDPSSLIQVMRAFFDSYHARVSLISQIGVFEGAITSFVNCLRKMNKITRLRNDHYKTKLEWAFGVALQSTYGKRGMIARIPRLCLDVDHARRIRNLWMHNNGLFNDSYRQGITVAGKGPIIEPAFREFDLSKTRRVPIVLEPEGFLAMSKSHIELLHQVHHSIQRIYYGQKRSYSYKARKKGIEWQRLLGGV